MKKKKINFIKVFLLLCEYEGRKETKQKTKEEEKNDKNDEYY